MGTHFPFSCQDLNTYNIMGELFLVHEFDKLIDEASKLQLAFQAEDREMRSEQLSSAREQIVDLRLEVNSLKSQLQSSHQVTTDLQKENAELRKLVREEVSSSFQSADSMNKDCGEFQDSDLRSEDRSRSKDVHVPAEESFCEDNCFTASTPFLRGNPVQTSKRRSFSLDLNFVLRTPIIPGRCLECLRSSHNADSSGDHVGSPSLPWCPHSASTANLSPNKSGGQPPVRSSAALSSTRNVLAIKHQHLFY